MISLKRQNIKYLTIIWRVLGTKFVVTFSSRSRFLALKSSWNQMTPFFVQKEVLGEKKKIIIWVNYGIFLQQLECGYRFLALIHVWIASAGVLELFISTSGEVTQQLRQFRHEWVQEIYTHTRAVAGKSFPNVLF